MSATASRSSRQPKVRVFTPAVVRINRFAEGHIQCGVGIPRTHRLLPATIVNVAFGQCA
jgi:hypothetical protein